MESLQDVFDFAQLLERKRAQDQGMLIVSECLKFLAFKIGEQSGEVVEYQALTPERIKNLLRSFQS